MPSFAASFEAIGVENRIVVDAPAALWPALAIARDEVVSLDRACSRFRADSELAAVNRAAGSAVRAGPLLLDVVATSLRVAAATGGLVDPTVGPALSALGYDRDFRLLASSACGTFEVRPAVGWRGVRVDPRAGTIRVPRGSSLDLGAVAKAYCADRIAERVRAAVGARVLVSLGGDVAVAGAPPGGWAVLVADDHRGVDATGQTVGVAGGGLATSSTAVRRWHAGERVHHHIVDPASGEPADERWRTVSVAAASCVRANAAATAAIVLGDKAPAWLEGLGLAARLVRPDGGIVTTAGWPEVSP
jgi:thiamine biosynthesis lipoprotein